MRCGCARFRAGHLAPRECVTEPEGIGTTGTDRQQSGTPAPRPTRFDNPALSTWVLNCRKSFPVREKMNWDFQSGPEDPGGKQKNPRWGHVSATAGAVEFGTATAATVNATIMPMVPGLVGSGLCPNLGIPFPAGLQPEMPARVVFAFSPRFWSLRSAPP